jgi:hypothetical protein
MKRTKKKKKENSQTSRLESSQVKLLITNNAFCIVQRATAQSKTGIEKNGEASATLC